MAITMAVGTPEVRAQEAPTPTDEGQPRLDDIVVTASRRAENILDEPYSISAITGDSLAKASATEYRDFLTAVPGVALVEAGLGTNNVIIRGLATAAGGSNLSGTVVTYFDETALSSGIRSIEVEPLDMERLEVLRGPQGTLFGAGSLGGTLRLIPQRPNFVETSLRMSATGSKTHAGDGLDSNLSAIANLPIATDIAALRIVGFRRQEADYIRNLQTGGKTGGGTVSGGRAALRIRPVSELDLLFQYVKDRTDADGARVREPFYGAGNVQRRRGDEFQDADLDLFNFTGTYDFGVAQLTAITSRYVSKLANRLDASLFDGNVVALAGNPARYGLAAYDLFSDDNARSTAFAQEVRLTSQGSDRLKWLVGAYYSNESLTRIQTFNEAQLLGRFLRIDRTNDAKQIAVFGEANVALGQQWGIDLGLRYSDYRQRTRVDANAGEQKQGVWTPRFNLRFQPGEQLFYLQVSRGFRLGGYNGPPPKLPGIVIADVQRYLTYGSDTLWNYELGTKMRLADGRLNVTAAMFHSDWADIPVYVTLAGGAYTPLANVGAATINGVEGEVAWAVARGLTLTASGSYTDARLKGSTQYASQRLPSSPSTVFNAGLTYEQPGAVGWRPYGGVNANYVGSYRSSLNEEFATNLVGSRLNTRFGLTRQPVVGDYVLFNLNAGVRRGGTDLSIFAKNLFGSEKTTLFNSFSYGGAPAESFVRPRTIGLTLRQDL
ncbi:TonB-dependent receptor [Sphingomonas sp. Leaf17]|uniref:TonB-dependent receptor n=1 Tax=Sphingomonas sp. Leaf17 TaxID=1735683 RepID=UPI00138F1359|nr:TonB-dependent receptor [Sphingomonas sp. Leaf17]